MSILQINYTQIGYNVNNIELKMIEFSKNLKNERILNGLTQKEMANKLGISYRTYQNYELTSENNREPDLKTLCKISEILSVSVDYLLGMDKY